MALVITEENYNAIPASEPFDRPSDPGTFALQVPSTVALQSPTAISRRTTRSTSRSTNTADLIASKQAQTTLISSAEVTTQKAAHDETVKRYYECQAVEQALCTQIIEAIEPEYLDVLRNINTDMINESIPEIFTFFTENVWKDHKRRIGGKGRLPSPICLQPTSTSRQSIYQDHLVS